MKKYIFIVFVLGVIIFWFTYLKPSLKIATGFTAKYTCSAIFISDLTTKNINSVRNDFLLKMVRTSIDHERKEVEASFFGWAKQKAVYYENGPSCGCLVGKSNFPQEVHSQMNSEEVREENTKQFWPQGDQLKEAIPPNIAIDQLNTLISNTLHSNPKIFAITVAYKDFLLAEQYNQGVNENTRLLGWSMTKSMGNALYGILAKNGILSIEETTGIKSWQGDQRKEITYSNLLQMSSGLAWDESYTRLSNVTRMLFLEKDFSKYALQSKAIKKPDEEWVYSSGTSNILSGILRTKFKDYTDYLTFPYDSLFLPIGMKSALIELDPSGHHVLSSYGWATARDWTRFGLLYLYRGHWFGQQIFSPEWVDYSTTSAKKSDGKYGAQLWVNSQGDPMPSVPHDAYFENGYGGQRVLIIPSKELVFVVLSGNQNDFDFDTFYKEALRCFDL